jgi:hypothetical protein
MLAIPVKAAVSSRNRRTGVLEAGRCCAKRLRLLHQCEVVQFRIQLQPLIEIVDCGNVLRYIRDDMNAHPRQWKQNT